MNSQPFIIHIDESDLPNLAADEKDSFGYEFDKTNIWHNSNTETLLDAINKKLDIIIEYLTKSVTTVFFYRNFTSTFKCFAESKGG